MNNRTITTLSSMNKKEREEILVEFLDYFCDSELMGFKLSNTSSLRRVLFFKYFLLNKGNATKSAIQAGYSPKSAKQQGYRVLQWVKKEIQKEQV